MSPHFHIVTDIFVVAVLFPLPAPQLGIQCGQFIRTDNFLPIKHHTIEEIGKPLILRDIIIPYNILLSQIPSPIYKYTIQFIFVKRLISRYVILNLDLHLIFYIFYMYEHTIRSRWFQPSFFGLFDRIRDIGYENTCHGRFFSGMAGIQSFPPHDVILLSFLLFYLTCLHQVIFILFHGFLLLYLSISYLSLIIPAAAHLLLVLPQSLDRIHDLDRIAIPQCRISENLRSYKSHTDN